MRATTRQQTKSMGRNVIASSGHFWFAGVNNWRGNHDATANDVGRQ